MILTTQDGNGEPDSPGMPNSPGMPAEDGVVPPERDASPLQHLIQQRLREQNWSYGEVARRGGLPRSTVYTLARTRTLGRAPRPATVGALARGLDIPVSLVRAAAAESTGLHYYDEPSPGQHLHAARERDLLIAGIDELSPDDRQHVAALVESLRNKAGRRTVREGGVCP